MIWFTWRQFRIQTWIAAAALAAIGVLLVVSAQNIADAYAAANVAACGGDCTTAISNFLQQAMTGASGTIYNVALAVVYGVPGLIGVFWGAPMVARELEAGTHQIAWTQSVTRTRWLAVKLAIVGAAAAVTAGLLSWAVTFWAQRIDEAAGDRITPLVFGARGIVPIGYAVLAFMLGVTAGLLIRRTVPAMAATLAIYVAAVAAMPLWIRQHLAPAQHATPVLDLDNLQQLTWSRQDGSMQIIGDSPGNAWVLSNQTITSTGEVFTGPANPQYCGEDAAPRACVDWIGTLGLRQDLTYQPTGHFWQLQWVEFAIFLTAAVLLAGLCFWRIRRHAM
jgi:hypothetical protein